MDTSRHATATNAQPSTSSAPRVSEDDDGIIMLDIDFKKGEISIHNPQTKKKAVRRFWRKEEMLESEISQINELLISNKMDPETLLWSKKEQFTAPPKPVLEETNLTNRELESINFHLAQENYALRLGKGMAIDAANKEKARADMEKERADKAEQQIVKDQETYNNALNYRVDQHNIDLQTNETIYKNQLEKKQRKIAELEEKIRELTAPGLISSSSRPSTSMDYHQTDSSTCGTPSPGDTVPGPSTPSAPKESWKKKVAKRHEAAYEKTYENMKFAPESFHNKDGPPAPQLVVEVPCTQIIYERMMTFEEKELDWDNVKKQRYVYLRQRLVEVQEEQQRLGYIEVIQSSKEKLSRAQKKRRNPTYEGVQDAHSNSGYQVKRFKPDQ